MIFISISAMATDMVKVIVWNGAVFPDKIIVPANEEFRLRVRNLDANLLKMESELLNINVAFSPHTDVIIGKLPLRSASYPLTTIFKDHSYKSEIIARR